MVSISSLEFLISLAIPLPILLICLLLNPMTDSVDYRKAIPAAFKGLYSSTPALLVTAPGRINLIGEHTDYNNGFVFPAAINKEVVFAISLSSQQESSLFAYNLGKGALLSHKNLLPQAQPGWINFFAGVVAGLQERGFVIPPVNCVFGGDIPNGAGLSSSAALEVGFATALKNLFDLPLDPWDIIQIAQKAEHEYVGVKCGIMDMFASTMGKKDHAMLLDCQNLEFEYYPVHLGGYQLLLIDTQVKHSLASSQYNIRRQECEMGVAALKKYKPNATSLRNFSSLEIEQYKSELPEKVYERCSFVSSEIERTQQAALDLQKGDIAAFGHKMFQTHSGLSAKYEVSCPELDFLAELAAKFPSKIPGARMMGGGFGGCTINIIQRDFIAEFKREVYQSYSRNFQRSPDFIEVAIEEGAGVL